jgi:hypothetical protein
MGNLLNEQKPEDAPKTYTEADMRAVQAETAARMLAEQNRMLQQTQRFGQAVPQRPSGPDPLMTYAENNLTQTPQENARLLDAATRGRAADVASQALNYARREFDGKLEALKNETAINSLLASNPDIARDEEGFAAALAKAQYRTQRSGIDADGPSLTRDALAIYRKERTASGEAPVLEGASRADGNSMPSRQAEAPKGKSHFEEFYGAAPGDELHEEKPDFEKMTQDYADGKNDYLESMGVAVSESKIRQVQGENMSRAARKAKRGAAA